MSYDGRKADTPEMIQKCLHCDRPECNNCYENGVPTVWEANAKKRAQIEALWKRGLTDHQIAAYLGLSATTISNHRREVLHLPPNLKKPYRRVSIGG